MQVRVALTASCAFRQQRGRWLAVNVHGFGLKGCHSPRKSEMIGHEFLRWGLGAGGSYDLKAH